MASEVEALRAFARKVLCSYTGGDAVGDIDGGTLQDYAEQCGLLKAVDVTESCGESCVCADYGMPAVCYRATEILSPVVGRESVGDDGREALPAPESTDS